MISTVKVSEKGQIAIPQSIREILRIQRGDELIILQSGEKILLEKSKRIEESMKDEFSDMLKLSEKSLGEIWDNKEDEIWNSYLK